MTRHAVICSNESCKLTALVDDWQRLQLFAFFHNTLLLTVWTSFPIAGITLPPPPENLCKAHQRRFDQMPLGEYRVECNYMDIQQKAAEGTLTINDVIDCYRPNCDGEKYARRQCSYNSYFHCWCSSEDGFVIPDTFEKDKPMGACGK